MVLWKQFKHPNLLQLMGAKKSSQALLMVSEWMEHGTIMDFVVACPGTNRLKLVSIPPKPYLKRTPIDAAFSVGGCCSWAGIPPRLALRACGPERRKPDLRVPYLIET